MNGLEVGKYIVDSFSGYNYEDSISNLKIASDYATKEFEKKKLSKIPSFIDNFDKPYTITSDGQFTPDKQWLVRYLSQGKVVCDGKTLVMQPGKAVGDGTRSVLLLSNRKFKNFEANFFMKTISQLKDPQYRKPWEVGWFMWSYNDVNPDGTKDYNHHYYCALKTNGGIEIGCKDYTPYADGLINSQGVKIPLPSNERDKQIFLDTSGFVDNFKLGQAYKFKVKHVDSHIQVYVNDVLKTDIFHNGQIGLEGASNTRPAPPPSDLLKNGGNVAFYNEDAVSQIDCVNIIDV